MTIAAPAIHWPLELHPAGPAEDATILLNGNASVGGVAFEVCALRMRRGHRGPDYRDSVPASNYEERLASMADDIEDLIGALGHELVRIDGADYLLWMVPSARG